MVEFIGLLGEAWRKFEETKWLLPVPVIMSLMDYGKLVKVLSFEGIHLGIRFPLPEPAPSLWSFVSLPTNTPGIELSIQGLMTTALFVILGSYLEAGYLGSIRDAVRTAEGSFFKNAERDFLKFLQFNLLVYTLTLTLGLPVMVIPTLFIPVMPMLLAFLYVVYGTPFLISIYGLGFTEALKESINLAKKGGEYLNYALKYLALGAVVSIPMTFIVVNGGTLGLLAGLIISAPLSLTLSTATVIFFELLREQNTAA